MRVLGIVASIVIGLGVAPVFADPCDYRPSHLLGKGASAVVGSAAGATAAAGVGAKAAGIYTLVHSTSGLTMLGSTLAGGSAAGTAGILGGTAGTLGTLGAIVTAPVTIIVTGVTAVAIGGYEGVCFFYDERVTDFEPVFKIMKSVSENEAVLNFRLVVPHSRVREMTLQEVAENADAYILLGPSGETEKYLIRNLYIVNGVLMHRDWFLNTTIGPIFYNLETNDQ